MSGKSDSAGLYFVIFAALLALTALTVWVAYLDLGPVNTPLAVVIASVKALLVVIFFMHLNHATALVRIWAGAALVGLLILLVLLMSDLVTRGPDALPQARADGLEHPSGRVWEEPAAPRS